MDFVITHKKLFITGNYMLRVIASFENETKCKVITNNFPLNETERVFSTILNPCFYLLDLDPTGRVSSGIQLRVITHNRIVTDFVITCKKLFIMRNYVLRIIASFQSERNVT